MSFSNSSHNFWKVNLSSKSFGIQVRLIRNPIKFKQQYHGIFFIVPLGCFYDAYVPVEFLQGADCVLHFIAVSASDLGPII